MIERYKSLAVTPHEVLVRMYLQNAEHQAGDPVVSHAAIYTGLEYRQAFSALACLAERGEIEVDGPILKLAKRRDS